MRVTVTGATGLIGRRLVGRLRECEAEITVLSRFPERARGRFEQAPEGRGGRGAQAGSDSPSGGHDISDTPDSPSGGHDSHSAGSELHAQAWDLTEEPAPTDALSGRHAVVHLAGEPVAQRWSAAAKRAIRESRVTGTRNLVAGLAACAESERPSVLVSSSAIGYYGAHASEPLDESALPGADFLAQTCCAWEAEAQAAERLGVRVVRVRTGVVLDRDGGALAKMLPPFKLGVGGPVAGGSQYVSWIHPEDLIGIMLTAIDAEGWSGPFNATAPQPLSNRDFSKTLGRVLHRPALLPTPALALRLLYGEMAEIVTSGARVLPAQALVNGYEFRYPKLEGALRAALS